MKTQITFLHGEETFSNKIKHINGNIANLATNSFLHSRVHVQSELIFHVARAPTDPRGYESNFKFNGRSPRATPFGDLSRVLLMRGRSVVRVRPSRGGMRCGWLPMSFLRARVQTSLKSPPLARSGLGAIERPAIRRRATRSQLFRPRARVTNERAFRGYKMSSFGWGRTQTVVLPQSSKEFR